MRLAPRSSESKVKQAKQVPVGADGKMQSTDSSQTQALGHWSAMARGFNCQVSAPMIPVKAVDSAFEPALGFFFELVEKSCSMSFMTSPLVGFVAPAAATG